MDDEFQLAKDLGFDIKGFALALSDEQHQHDMVASMRKTVKQVVSDYHTSEKAVTLENEDARKLIAMITVILKHGLIDRYNGNLVNFWSLVRLNVPKMVPETASWFSSLESANMDGTLAQTMRKWLLQALNEKQLYTHLSAVLYEREIVATWYRRDSLLQNQEVAMVFIDLTALLDSVTFELVDKDVTAQSALDGGALNVQRRRAKKTTRVALIDEPHAQPVSSGPSAEQLELERQRAELEAQRSRMAELEAQQKENEIKLLAFAQAQREQAILKERQEEEERLLRAREKEEADRIARQIEEQVQEQLARERKLIEEAVMRQMAEEDARRKQEEAAKEQERQERLRVEQEIETARLTAEHAARLELARLAAEAEAKRIEAERLEAERVAAELEAERLRLENERLAAEETARIERERIFAEQEAKRIELERIEAQRLETERLAAAEEAARLERERVAAERLEAERIEAERLEKERLAAEEEAARLEVARIAAEEEAKRIEAGRIEMERVAAEKEAERIRLENERLVAAEDAARIEREHIFAEEEEARAAAEAMRLEAERLENERSASAAAAEEAVRLERERVAAEAEEANRLEAERVAAEQEAERIRLENVRIAEEAKRIELERAEAERVEAERFAAEAEAKRVAEAERLEAERIAAVQEAERIRLENEDAARLERERVAAERLEAERIEAERLEKERLAAEEEAARLEVARIAAEEEAKRIEAGRIEMERVAAEKEAERIRLENERLVAEEEAARVERERIAAEEEAALVAAEAETMRLEAEKEAERIRHENDRLAAEDAARIERERIITEEEAKRIALERAEEEARRIEAERLENERLASVAAAAAAEAERLAKVAEAERLAKEAEIEAKRLESLRLAAVEAELKRLEEERLATEAKRAEEARMALEAEAQRKLEEEQRMQRIQEEINRKLAAERQRIEAEVLARMQEAKRKQQEEEARIEREKEEAAISARLAEEEAERAQLALAEEARALEARQQLEARLEALKQRKAGGNLSSSSLSHSGSLSASSSSLGHSSDHLSGSSAATSPMTPQNPYAIRGVYAESLARSHSELPLASSGLGSDLKTLASDPSMSLLATGSSPSDEMLSPAALAATLGSFVKPSSQSDLSTQTSVNGRHGSAGSSTGSVTFNRGMNKSDSASQLKSGGLVISAPIKPPTLSSSNTFIATSIGNQELDKPIDFYTTVSLSSLLSASSQDATNVASSSSAPGTPVDGSPTAPKKSGAVRPKPITNVPPALNNGNTLDDFNSLSTQDMEFVVEEYESMSRDPNMPFVSPTLAPTPKMSQEWIGPKRQIYFDIPDKVPFDQQPSKVCAKCEQPLSHGLFGNARYCNYSGRYYCKYCHVKDLVIIPAYVLRNWDFTPRPVSKFYREFLDTMMDEPLYDPKVIDSSIIEKVPALKKIQAVRIVLYYQHRYFIRSCRHKDALMAFVDQLFPGRPHLINDRLLSLQDFIDAHKGKLLEVLLTLAKLWTQHILECNTCKAKGSYCEFCSSKEVIYPFHLKHTCICPDCSTVAHRRCYRPGYCPRCKRLDRRQQAATN